MGNLCVVLNIHYISNVFLYLYYKLRYFIKKCINKIELRV